MTGSVQKVDRSAMIEQMKQQLTIDPTKTVAITIDMQRGGLDPELGTLPVPIDEVRRILAGTRELLPKLRSSGIQVIHVVSHWYPFERGKHPFVQALDAAKVSLTPHARHDMARHKLLGSRGAQMMPELGPEAGDLLVDSKRRFDSFYGTNLEILLRDLKTNTLILLGANTNTCVQCTAFAAYCRDFKIIVAADCVASAYGQDLHEFALENIRRRLGWVLTNQEIVARIGASHVG